MVLMAILQRWLLFGWIGRAVAVIVTLYGTGWIVGNLGMDGAARSLGRAAILVLSVLLAWLFIRLIWRDATSHHRR